MEISKGLGMTQARADRYRRWFDYELDAHGKVLESLHAAAPSLGAHPAVQKAIDLGAHDGGRFRNRVEDILTQLFSHSSYHRGQIALLLRQAGAEPAVTGFIYWAREPAWDAAW